MSEKIQKSWLEKRIHERAVERLKLKNEQIKRYEKEETDKVLNDLDVNDPRF